MKKIIIISVVLLSLEGYAYSGEILLIDDFSSAEKSRLTNTKWEGITDQVMGGKSDIYIRRIPAESGNVLKMEGNVSLEKNGGFIQVRLLFKDTEKYFNAEHFKGIEIRCRGKGDNYYIFLRTSRTKFPWSHFAYKIPVNESWQTVKIPFVGFLSKNMFKSRLRTNKLKSIAVAAAENEFYADIEIDYLAFYR